MIATRLRTLGVASSVVASCMFAVGCGAASSAAGGASYATRLRPEADTTYVFSREVSRTRRGEENVALLAGELRVDAPGAHRLTITRARESQAGQVLREIDPPRIGEHIFLEQRLTEGGRRALPIEGDEAFALGGALTQALGLAPVGGTGLDLPIRGDAVLVIGWPTEAGLPAEVRVRCNAIDVPEISAWARVECEGRLDRALEVSDVARADGVTAELRGTVHLRATIDRATGMGRQTELRISMDVVQHLGPYEEHDAAELRMLTEIDPMVQ